MSANRDVGKAEVSPGGGLRKRRRLLLRFALFLGILAAMSAMVLGLMRNEAAISSLQRAIAGSTSAVLRVLGTDATTVNSTIVSDRFSISVVAACTGLFLAVAFVSAVLAYPAGWRAKLLGLAGGMSVIYAMNVVRLVVLFYVGVFFPQRVEQMHLLVLQSLSIVGVLVLWLIWVERVAHARRT
ncbi:archaeosortase/exosortase family protein [Candidatus Bipolaricaulota bacterium]|nr:archaeosortase/exosortase family protein [Candidatus Bipolaricaulota bacterium]